MSGAPLEPAAEAPGPRIAARLRAAPGVLALGTLAAVVTAYLLTGLAAGGVELLGGAGDPLRVQPIVRFNLVLALIFALTVWSALEEPRALAHDLAELRPILDCSDEEHAGLAGEALSGPGGAAGLLGATFGVGLVLISIWAGRSSSAAWSCSTPRPPGRRTGSRRSARCSPTKRGSNRSASGPSTRRLWYDSPCSS